MRIRGSRVWLLRFRTRGTNEDPIMESIDCTYRSQASIHIEATTVFVSLELSRARWLVTSLSPNTSKISRHFVPGGDAAELLRLLSELRAKAERHVNAAVKITCIQEIGFDGFWIHRVLAVCKQNSKPLSVSCQSPLLTRGFRIGAVCGNPARTDLRGGRSVMTVPTALQSKTSVRTSMQSDRTCAMDSTPSK